MPYLFVRQKNIDNGEPGTQLALSAHQITHRALCLEADNRKAPQW
jgi:hypothetical protein